MISRALVNSPAHLFTVIEESENMKEIELILRDYLI